MFFNMFMLALRTVSVFFKGLNDLMPTPIPISYLLIQMVLWNAALIIEIPIFFIQKLYFLRGFFLTSLPIAGSCILSIYLCTTAYKTNAVLVSNLTYYATIQSIIIAIVYSANWICGALQITVFCIIISISFLLMPGHPILDKPFVTILNITISAGLILVLYYFEYFQRKAIFMKVEAEKLKNNLKLILERLPEPILITVEKEVQYSNVAYSKAAINDKSEHLSQNEEEEEEKSSNSNEFNITNAQLVNEKLEEEFLQKLTKTKAEKTLKEVIEDEEQLTKVHFDIKIGEDIKDHFEITSIDIVLGQKNAILYLLKNMTAFSKIKKLQARERYQRIYFASITHDFRTPIGIISGSSEILLDLINDDYQRSQIININQASSMLLLLVQDILDYSQLKAGKLQIAPSEFIVEKEFSSLVGLFIPKYQDKGLILTLNINRNVPETIFNDANRIKQILMNLISNAFKFTRRGSVDVNVDFCEEDRKVIVYVKDTSVGMDPIEAQSLFKEYSKIDRHKDLNPMGIGLGLHISKQLVIKLGGMISVQSQVGVGTTFQFSVSSNLENEDNKYK